MTLLSSRDPVGFPPLGSGDLERWQPRLEIGHQGRAAALKAASRILLGFVAFRIPDGNRAYGGADVVVLSLIPMARSAQQARQFVP